nr:hypothetical protein HAGR004_12170 [Bdellovibrio sp. HAGR004]
MKFTLIILTVLAPFFAHAGGGGGLRPGMQPMMMSNPGLFELGGTGGGGVVKSPEIVFHMGQKNGLVKFAYGHLEGNQWQVQKVQISELDLIPNANVVEALKQSQQDNNWAQIK